MKKIFILMIAVVAFSAKINAQVKVGTNPTAITPNTNLEVQATNGSLMQVSKDAGKVIIKDGTQAIGNVLTSDASGVASWKPIPPPTALAAAITLIFGTLGAGVNLVPSSTTLVNTGSSITLPPGKWLVTGFFLLTKQGGYTGTSESWWVKLTFTDTISGTVRSSDVPGTPFLISGLLPPSSTYGLANGIIIINNTSSGNKTYHLAAFVDGSASFRPTGSIMAVGGDVYGENVFYANQIK